MEPPPTPKPTLSTPPTSDATGQSSQFLGVLYLALTGLIDSVLPVADPWAVDGKALSYLLKLGPIIWWAMQVPALTPPSPAGASQYSWYPESSGDVVKTSTTRIHCPQNQKPMTKSCQPEVRKKQRRKTTWYKNPSVIFHLNSSQVDNQAITPSRDQPADPPQALYCPPQAPFGPVHFTKYPPNPAYLEYNLETILIAYPLERTRETKYIGHKGKWYKRLPRLFKDKYNYLLVYFIPMNPPLTP
ncbi:hypothetical protein DSO57_1011981 [Entomophthora muscae]|uniref:Uncharacterized protein n=1 Tax=Entomophthora muscae TaxID=34485 RepID=A0ACC2THC9_9FUNG|nr:hypothetical protein DSO57_1011981 [Entomophthora muscae]